MGGIFKYELDKMSSSVHSVPLCDLSILVNQRPMGNILIWKTGPKGERTPREGIGSGNQLCGNPLILHF